ncbi:MAG: LysM peptidoglycan-binding domain-containing protein [Bacilli bacterium]|nr:LysM peptidoglycan-binding domain-containing protein [Bacilli bacterium]
MNISIPFNKVIPFKSNIAEICSISLEHDISINEGELLGDFLISGEYKNLDINVDTMPFEHVVPFSVKLDNDIILDTLNYEVEDFTYEIKDGSSLCINIVLHVSAEKNIIKEKEEIFNEKVDVSESDRLDLIEEEQDKNINIEEEIELDNIVEKKDNDIKQSNIDLINESNLKQDYITYHIHYVKINETLDSISAEYKIEKEKLMELNDTSSLQVGDKIIIPDLDE